MLLEALSSGLPIVTTDMVVAHSVVDEGVNGAIVSRHDSVEFAQALATLLEDPVRRREFGLASLRKSKDFDLTKMVDDTLRVYVDMLPPSRQLTPR